MSLSPLAAKLQAHATLLPSQRELLERVLFQIEFNGFQHIHLVGGTGSGKTTLSLVLAELLSNSMNLAYFAAQPDMTTAQCQKLLLQQWFGVAEFDANLMALLEQPQQQPLVWILDSQGSLPLGCLSLLRAHPIHIITTGSDALPDADLNLTIAPLTEAEVEQLLPAQMLHTRSAAERMRAAAGDLHRLLEPEVVPERSDSKPVAVLAQKYRTASLVLAVLGVGAILVFWWLPQPTEPLNPDNQPRPVAQAWSPVDAGVSEIQPAHLHADEPQLGSANRAETRMQEVEIDTLAYDDEELADVPLPEILPDTPSLSVQQNVTTEQAAIPEMTAKIEAADHEPAHDIGLASETTATEAVIWLHDEAALLAMDEAHFVLQLGVFSNLNAALTMRQSYPDLAMFIYQRQLNDQSQWVVVLAAYPTADQARAVRTQIPERLRAETPFIKALQQVWQEIHSTQPAQGSRSQ